MPYYPKEYALRELTQLYSFTGLKVIQNLSHTENETDEQHNVHHHNLFLDQVPNQTQGIDTIPIINHKTHHTTEIETIHIIEIEVIRTIEIRITRTIDQERIHLIDQTITDQMIIIKADHKTIHKIETQVTIIDIEIFPRYHTGIITIIKILNVDTEVVHQNIKDTSIKCRQMKKQHETPQVLMTQEVTNYN